MSDSTTTPNIGLKKPTYDSDEDQWGYDLNDNCDVLDTLLAHTGTTTFLPTAGGTMTGNLTLPNDPSSALQAATKQYVDAHVFTDAANDTFTYGRHANAWQSVVPLAGGTMTGLLTLSADPTAAQGAATKGYVDARVASGVAGVAQFNGRVGTVGFLATDLTSVNGAVITASDTAPASPVANQLWFDSVGGQLYIWFGDANSSQWVSTTSRRLV
jgi:hypothetical protein